ncbi:MAG TPA: hypothetical protein VFR78_03380, partial [Pyrinomonadaceae bacterium]|nr:hypothetical protein [Pyrinomonadaceae bacterium]
NSRADKDPTGKSFESIRDVGTDAVIEGQVQKHAERFRISVRLVRTSDGVALWADQVETGFTDDLSIEDRVSALVAEAVLTRTAD